MYSLAQYLPRNGIATPGQIVTAVQEGDFASELHLHIGPNS